MTSLQKAALKKERSTQKSGYVNSRVALQLKLLHSKISRSELHGFDQSLNRPFSDDHMTHHNVAAGNPGVSHMRNPTMFAGRAAVVIIHLIQLNKYSVALAFTKWIKLCHILVSQ